MKVGGPAFTLTVMGGNFTSTSNIGLVYSNSIALLQTQEISTQELQTQVLGTSFQSAVNLTVVVMNRDGSESNSVTIVVTNPAPTLKNLGTTGAMVGTAGVTLTFGGSNFVPNSTVDWNGTPLSTTFQDTTEISASIPASDLTSMQTAQITVVNPKPGGGTTAAQYFTVYQLLNQPVNDIVWDSAHQLLYASVPSSASSYANDILTINPSTGTIVSSQPGGSDPDVLAISDNDQYLYVGDNGSSSIQRFLLPNMTPDISWSLGSGQFGANYALDIQVAPGEPHTTAVTLGENVSPPGAGGIVIYDDSTPRPTTIPGFPASSNEFEYLQWGGSDTALYGDNTFSIDSVPFFDMSVDANGVTLTSTTVLGPVCGAIHYDVSTGHIYCDGGTILDTSGNIIRQFQSSLLIVGAIAPDSSINRAFQIYSLGTGAAEVTIQSFDMTTLQPVASLNSVPVTANSAPRMIRWGSNGLALIVNNAFSNYGILLLQGSFIH